MTQKTFILFFLLLLLGGCVNSNNTNCNNGKQSFCQSLDTTAFNVEDFSEFIKKFHSDTLFQQHRLSKVVTGYNSDDDTLFENNDSIMNYSWTAQELIIYLKWINEDKIKSEYETTITIVSDSVITEKIYIPQSSCFYDLKFSTIEEKWFLTDLIVNTL